MLAGEAIVSVDQLRQGDVVALEWLPVLADGTPDRRATPHGVVILSQTCDVVQDSKQLCLVAPIVPADAAMLSAARKGQLPLRLYLPPAGSIPAQLADVEQMASVPKSMLRDRLLISRRTTMEQSEVARNLADRIGRVFTRFPFPDEVYPTFQKLRKKAQSAVGGAGAFGSVLDHVEELRVGADQWTQYGRRLTLHVIIPSRHLINAEDADPGWDWAAANVHGRRRNERRESLTLDRISELLAANLAAWGTNPESVDMTTVLRLWEDWCAQLQSSVLSPVGNAVSTFKANLVSDTDFSYAAWRASESLDLEVLSDSRSSFA
ncbi:hypothetical protein E3T24_05505 [Cryobacterium sp. TmT2-59]|uniref:hypothetical protein n=1 Tax=Cryobacterium sp. TmT2-59 TaxID=1259264 RepID=UPI0010696AC0|nr:hypothetical protein [Cryobacterium sp. TmT2-59]TFC87167.1 hypothetical protein E3T24_05505 [Cryobacterium sp. TmT2-59]